MYDQYSTDGSEELAKSLGFEVRNFGSRSQLNDQWYLDVKNHCWKEERGKGVDYVIVCDADEFVQVAQYERPVMLPNPSAPRVLGFNMISDVLPKENIFEVNTGEYSESYSKQAIFNPDKVEEINFVHGCHRNNMVGDITRDGIQFRLFHFRQIGGVQRLIDRHAVYRSRKSAFNETHGMGIHYGKKNMTPEEVEAFNHGKREEWKTLTENAKELW